MIGQRHWEEKQGKYKRGEAQSNQWKIDITPDANMSLSGLIPNGRRKEYKTFNEKRGGKLIYPRRQQKGLHFYVAQIYCAAVAKGG